MTDAVTPHRLPRSPWRTCARPFLFEPLERAVAAPCVVVAARQLGVNTRQIHRSRHSGLTAEQADVLAFRIGLHPCEVWGNQWWSTATTD